MSPSVEALLVTPAAPHSAYNRGLVLSVDDSVALEILPERPLAVEVDGQLGAQVESRRSDRDAAAARARPSGAARPHDVLRTGPAQAAADRAGRSSSTEAGQ